MRYLNKIGFRGSHLSLLRYLFLDGARQSRAFGLGGRYVRHIKRIDAAFAAQFQRPLITQADIARSVIGAVYALYRHVTKCLLESKIFGEGFGMNPRGLPSGGKSASSR